MAQAAFSGETTDAQPHFEVPPAEPQRKKPGPKPGTVVLSNEVSPNQFDVEQQDIPEGDWANSNVFVWRRDPYTDTTNGGRDPKYIDCINRPMTEDVLKELHGSGTYRVHLNRNGKYACHTILTVEDPKFPPHIPPGDWLNNPRNKKWLSWKPLVEKWWDAELKKLTSAPVQTSSDQTALGELTRLVAHLTSNPNRGEGDKLSSVLIQWALQQTADDRKAERDADDPGKLAQLISAVKGLMPPTPPAADNTLLTFVLAQLTEVQKQNGELVKMMLSQKTEASKSPDPLSQVETMAKLITTVSTIVQPAAPKEPWVETIETLGPGVINALDKFATGFAMTRNMPQRPPQQPQGPRPFPQQAQPNPAQVVTVQPEPATQTQPSGNEPPPPEVPTVATTAPGEPDMDTAQRSMIWQIAILAANALNLRMNGDHFAEQICYAHGEAIYEQFITSVPKESLLARFKAVPEAWQVLSPYEQVLPTFIDSFYAFATEGDEDETKPISPEPIPVKTAKKKAKAAKA